MIQEQRTLKQKFFLVLKGLAMGAANKVPGVSGGVVAFVTGFYEEFIYSLKQINTTALKLLVNGRFKSFYYHINGPFLTLLFTGIILSFFSVSKLLDYLIKHFELLVWSLFFGLIIGSIYQINKNFKDWNLRTYTALLLGILIGISVSFLNPAKENDNLWFVFFCGIISVSGMTLPGFSGSFLLILIGNYVLLLVDSVNALSTTLYEVLGGNYNFLNNPQRIRMLKVLIIFTLGSIAGLVSFSHALSYILKRYKSITLSSIIGFIIGSLGVVWPWKKIIFKKNINNEFILDSRGLKIIENYKRYIPEINVETIYATLCIITGVLIVLILESYNKKTTHTDV